MLAGKKILLAVCGSIAAYKTAFFVRLLVKAGAEVKVIMTDSAKGFITPLTLSTLSKNPVYSEFVKNEEGEWNNHVELGMWPDLMIIAPLSANTLGKIVQGICDNLLMAVYLSAKCPVMASPAMDLDMYSHETTQSNLEKIREFGHIVIDAESGELASGLSGQGRMAEPEILFTKTVSFFNKQQQFKNQKVLITSGPTHEAIDPVRFIGNHSTGKMGKAIALELANRGAKVTFVSGPVNSYPTHPSIELVKVTSARQMLGAAESVFPDSHIAIFTAAVADFRPKSIAQEKIKKQDSSLNIKLVANPDIAKTLGDKKTNQFTVGFALETNNEEANASKKLKSKHLNLIVLNSLKNEGAGFAHDTNKVTIFDAENNTHDFELKRKEEVAVDLVDIIFKKINA
ncbi:MAG: bifunctional phosphopantothenoylcysteine decarboxylase/phosphopantothenate--cysteine ligase CoaBC [Cyclobacteriaceae bacterium]